MFDIKNQIVKAFRMARYCFTKFKFLHVKLRLLRKYHDDSLQYNALLGSKIARLIVDNK